MSRSTRWARAEAAGPLPAVASPKVAERLGTRPFPIRMEDGSIEEIYACTDAYGKEDLGINASNDEFLKRHGLGEFDREFYSLSSFSLRETELCQSEPIQGHSGMEMK